MAITNADRFTAGYTGCKVISGTSAVAGSFRGFVVNEEATITNVLDKDGGSLMTALGLTGVTLKSGAYIVVADGEEMTSIQLATGSVVAYNL
jgi:hypothetical protein